MSGDRILVTICARGGSKGVPGKNIRPLLGKPLIQYTIHKALDWGPASHVVVSTDSEQIAAVARECGAEVPFMRPAELSTDTAGKIPVIRHALKSSESYFGETFTIVVDLDVTCPVRTVEDLYRALTLFQRERPKTLFSVVPARRNPYFNMVEDQDGRAVLVKPPDASVIRRQDAPIVYDLNSNIYFYRRDYLLDEENNSAISDGSVLFIMDELSATDIDREIDFQLVELMAEKGWINL